MASRIHRAIDKALIAPPKWTKANLHFEGWTGSVAYGCSNDASDMDIYGWVIPPKTDIFPHLQGHINGFGEPFNPFSTWQQHHIEDKEKRVSYDVTLFSIVHFFNLAMQNNPNMIDVLFLPRRCVLHTTQIGEHVLDNRKLFLHKGCWSRFRGYSFAQLSKIRNKNRSSNPKRAGLIEEHGYDTKFAYHVIRLLLEVEEILLTGDLHLDKNKDILVSIRNGEWTLERIEEWSEEKQRSLETVYTESKLREVADEEAIKKLMLECLEQHYGSIDDAIRVDKSVADLVNDLENVLLRYRNVSQTHG
jgi:predicted nucleotidyltransferase